jgi:hypothetical protein
VIALIISLWNWPLRAIAVDGATDPFSPYSALGVAGVACGVFGVMWRDASKQRDKAQTERDKAFETLQQLVPLMHDLTRSVDGATAAATAQAKATADLVEATRGMPDQQTWYKLIDIASRSARRTQ